MAKSLRLLIVDDDAPIRRSLARVLRTRGFEIELASDGEAAIVVAERFQPDCLLIDIRLPGIDGVETFTAIRGILPRVPAVFMTAYAASAQARAAHELGAIAVLAKPLDVASLSELIEVCRQTAPVLIVDDDRNLLLSLARALSSAGISVETATTIGQALVNVRQRPDRVVVADVFLNDGFGYELLREMASQPTWPAERAPLSHNSLLETPLPSKVGPETSQRGLYSLVLVTGQSDWLQLPMPEPLRESRLNCLSKPLDVQQLIGQIKSLQISEKGE